MQKKDVRLTKAQKDVVKKLRNGHEFYLIKGTVYMDNRQAGRSFTTIDKLHGMGILKPDNEFNYELTDLGRTINID